MADETRGTTPPNSATDTLDHMKDELEELEHQKPAWTRWLIGAVVLIAIVAAVWYFQGQGGGQQALTTAEGGERIDLREPASGKLAQAPTNFRWESVAGRHHYIVVITSEKGDMAPIEKNVRNNNVQLTASEIQMLKSGQTYVWKVMAIADDGKTMASGAARFEL